MDDLNAAEILRLLAAPSETFLQIRLRKQASIREMCRALAQTTDAHSRQVLCDVLGFRHAKSAVSLLIECLADPSIGVRASAADAPGVTWIHGSNIGMAESSDGGATTATLWVTESAESGAGDEVIISIAGQRHAIDEIAACQNAADEKRKEERSNTVTLGLILA